MSWVKPSIMIPPKKRQTYDRFLVQLIVEASDMFYSVSLAVSSFSFSSSLF